jgi:Ca2+-binding EF-hand superfamily protein
MDTDGDGVVSDEERSAAMKQRLSRMRDRLDADGDGKLTPAELAAAPGRMHFDNPEALDTNHDGNIDADELAAGMKARREAFRAARQAQDGDAGSAANANPPAKPQ